MGCHFLLQGIFPTQVNQPTHSSNFIYPLPPVSLHFTLLSLPPISLFPQMNSRITLVDLSLVCLIASKSLSITSVLISSWSLALSSSQAVPKW